MPTARDIRARNELFAKRARDTQDKRNSKGENKRGLVHTHTEPEEKKPEASPTVRYLAIFLIFVLLGGFLMEALDLFLRSIRRA